MPPLTPSEKSSLVAQVRDHMAAGLSQNRACGTTGVSVANYKRWSAALDGADGDTSALMPAKIEGRPPAVVFTEDEARALRRCRLEKGSVQLAVEMFVRDEDCRPETAAALTAYLDKSARRRTPVSWPESVRKAAHVTAEEKAMYRGAKHTQAISVVERRKLTWIDEDGREWALAPGSIYESDDMSANEGFRYYDADLGRETVGRQLLATKDTFTLRWLAGQAIGRKRDAYRVEDIADHFRDVINFCGMPLIWRVEKGVWENNFIYGVKLEDGTRWGGLDKLFHIAKKHTSRGKANVENGFDFLQSVMAHQSTSIGRTRGEFEQGTKLWLKAGKGHPDALRYFWPIGEFAAALSESMALINSRAMLRRAFGKKMVVPDELWADHRPRPLPSSEAWRLCPVKKEATVRQGVIETTAPHYERSFRYLVHGAEGMPTLDHGHAVLIAFHPGEPEKGMHVFNADRTVKNRDHLGFGEKIGIAEHMPDVPMEDFSGGGDYSNRKKSNAAVRSEFRSVVPRGTGPGTLRSNARDGLGNSLGIQQGAILQPDGTPAKAPRRGTTPDPVIPAAAAKEEMPTLPKRSKKQPAETTGDRLARLRELQQQAQEHF